MYITMDENTHTYFVDGQVADISVTELLHKHGLAPSYDGVDEEVLNASRERGKEVHADIEKYIMADGYVPETREGLAFAHWSEKNGLYAYAEKRYALKWKGIVVACTMDLIGWITVNGRRIAVLADHKTTSRFQREYVSWQVSIEDYFARKQSGVVINNATIEWNGAEKFLCFLYDKDGNMEVKECDKIPDSEIERLLDCEANGEIYTRPALVLEDDMAVALEKAELAVIETERAAKTAKAQAEALRAALCAEMERQGIFSWSGAKIKATYRAGSERVSVDSTRLKKELPEVYEKYTKTSKVKATVVITEKGEKNEE